MTTELRILLEALPHEARPVAEKFWNQMPADMRREAELTLGSFVKLARQNPASVTDLLKLLQRTTAPLLDSARKVAILGPVNVGKSTLYNSLVHREQEKAACSPVPGTTRTVQSSETGLFRLLDTPGADHGGESGSEERDLAFAAAEEADFLLVVFDAAGSVTSSDRALYRRIRELGKPHLVVLNKIDLIRKNQRPLVRESAARILDLPLECIIPVSAQNSTNIDQLILEITAAEPKLLLKVAESLPSLRRSLGWQAIRRAAVLSALVGLSPLPLTDVIPLTLLQGNMVLTISQIYGHPLTFKRIVELASTFGAGWVARLLFQELTKFGGVPGWVLSASVAASATLTIGFASLSYFETGQMPEKQAVEKQARGLQQRIKALFLSFGRSKPSAKKVTQELEGLLPDLFPEEVGLKPVTSTGELDPSQAPEPTRPTPGPEPE